MLQEYTTLHVQLAQTQGQILVRKFLLRNKTNSHRPPAQHCYKKGCHQLLLNFSVGFFHAQGDFLRFTVTAPSRQAPA